MTRALPQPKNGILIAEGYGLRVTAERKHLVVEDGICDERRRGRFAKATARLRRLAFRIGIHRFRTGLQEHSDRARLILARAAKFFDPLSPDLVDTALKTIDSRSAADKVPKNRP